MMTLFTSQDVNSGLESCSYQLFGLFLTAPILWWASNDSKSVLMMKLTHLCLGWSKDEYSFKTIKLLMSHRNAYIIPIWPDLTSTQDVKQESLCQYHLSCPECTTPPTVWSDGGAWQSRELFSIGQPNSWGEVLSKSINITCDNIVI